MGSTSDNPIGRVLHPACLDTDTHMCKHTCTGEAMSQLTIYVPEEEARAIRKAARAAKRSVSEWARAQMALRLRSTWPEGYGALFGAVADETLQRPEQPGVADDVRRESL